MIYLYFFLKFKTQLRRTRSDTVRLLEDSLSRIITDAGGKISSTRNIISAVFNEDAIGIWLDIYILIENLKKSADTNSELFGYSLVISSNPHEASELLCRFLASGLGASTPLEPAVRTSGGGVFMDFKSTKSFLPYAVFEKPSQWLKDINSGAHSGKYGSHKLYKLKELKVFKATQRTNLTPQKEIANFLEQEKGKNVLFMGTSLRLNSGVFDFPPLTICFGSFGIGALVDAWSQNIRSLDFEKSTEEIDFLWELLFRERIRDEVSDFIVRSTKRFLFLLICYYFNAAEKKKRVPVIILENIHLAGEKQADFLIDTLSENFEKSRQQFVIMGSSEAGINEQRLNQWKNIFDVIKSIDVPKPPNNIPHLSVDFLEIIYALSVFGRYFSPEFFARLFEEEEKNPAMTAKALSILHALGVIDNPYSPWPVYKPYEEYARKMLGRKTLKIKEMVRSRLLNWAAKRNINPCFRLLTIIASLDGVNQIDDLLFLKSITSDIVNETTRALEAAFSNGQIAEIASPERAAVIHFVFKTSKALYTGKESDIDKVFIEPIDVQNLQGGEDIFSVFKAQLIVNFSGYYLGRHDIAMAAEKAKEAILLGQSKNSFCLSQGYRMFALVCLSKQQTQESIEYLSFALANAEKTGNYHEMGISSYYAAAVFFLYGDVYNAAKLAKKSIEQSIAAGRSEWADRSGFLEGRLEFELGNYSKALNIFEALREKPYGGNTEEKANLLEAWIYRTKVYLGDTKVSKPNCANHDAGLFEIEAAYLHGEYQKAVTLAGALHNPFPDNSFLYTEQPNWSSGFAQVEQLYFSQGEIQDRMICLFHSLSLSYLKKQDSSHSAAQHIQRILRNETLSEMDPWDAFYFYGKYAILKNTGAGPVDMSTAVSMAFKRLQRRASRIEDIETRRQYLNGPSWNRELYAAAKDFKLI